MLTAEMLSLLLNELGYVTVVEPTQGFPFRVQREVCGYREGLAGKAQATLSIMLEAKTRSVPRG
jgi:hypothetical protein